MYKKGQLLWFKRLEKQWDNVIVTYVCRTQTLLSIFSRLCLQSLKPEADFSIFSKENGFYVIKFQNKKDCDKVLEGGPYYYSKKLMVMKRWTCGMQFNKKNSLIQSQSGFVFLIFY